MLLLSVSILGAIRAQTVMEVEGIKGESNYSFAQEVHTLDLCEFDAAKEMMDLAIKPPSGYRPVFEIGVQKTPDLTSPKFAEALLKNNNLSSITIRKFEKGQLVTIVKMEGVRIIDYSLSSESYDESFVLKAERAWYEIPSLKYKVGYDFNNLVPLK